MRQLDKETPTTGKMSRRQLLRQGSAAIVARGVGACAVAVADAFRATSAVAASAAAKCVDYYEKLGVIPFINAAGTYTILSIMPDEFRPPLPWQQKSWFVCSNCMKPPEIIWPTVESEHVVKRRETYPCD